MLNLVIKLEDILTSNSCSVIVIAIIKYIAYNAKQIPFSYEAFTRTVSLHSQRLNKHKEVADSQMCSKSIKEKKALSYLQKILGVFENFEFTFKNLQYELWSLNVKEVMLIVGPNLCVPKQVLRIILPTLSEVHSVLEHHERKNLLSVFRKLQDSKELNDRLFGTTGPSKMFVLLGMRPCISGPQTSWFQQVDHVTITDRTPQIIINLVNPDSYLVDENIIHTHEEVTKIKSYTWYRSINIIEGFKDFKIDGISAVNVFTSCSKS
ncbi:uncharacterized protein [Rhodnius prolixus]